METLATFLFSADPAFRVHYARRNDGDSTTVFKFGLITRRYWNNYVDLLGRFHSRKLFRLN